MSCSTGPLANSAEFLSNDPLSALLGWSLHKNGRRHDGGLNSLNTSFFHGSSNQALWNIHTAVSPSGIDTEWEASQEFLPPLTQLIAKCKRTTKITRKIKRPKQSHCYYPSSVATDRLVLAGDVETNPAGADLGGGCRGCAPSPEITRGFLIQLVFCKKKKNYVVYWC